MYLSLTDTFWHVVLHAKASPLTPSARANLSRSQELEVRERVRFSVQHLFYAIDVVLLCLCVCARVFPCTFHVSNCGD